MSNATPSQPLDHAFENWLELLAQCDSAEVEPAEIDEFLLTQPEELRAELRAMISDEQVLRQATSEQTPIDAGRVISDFRLVRKLGDGAMGAVWEAEQLSLKSRVALKLLKPHLSVVPTALQRFTREAQAGGQMQHVGIVKTFAVGEANGVHWIAQELIPGGRTLASELEIQRRKLELPSSWYALTAARFKLLANALYCAHQAGIIHRDIKPGNILLTPDGDPKLADFGLAQIRDDLRLSRSGEILGTPVYMSPEQATSPAIELDARSDVFSLGAALYETLTFTRAFDGDDSQQVAHKIRFLDPMEPNQIHSRVPSDLSVICLKCLEKDKRRRYASMAELAADLERYLDHRPILAQPPTKVQMAGKWLKRHPVVAASGAVAAIALVTISILFAQLQGEQERTSKALAQTMLVAEFQTNQLKGVRPQLLGQLIRAELFVSTKELGAPNFTDIGLAVLHKMFFARALESAGDFEGQPAVHAQLLQTISLMMQDAGVLYEAVDPQTRALEIRRKLWGRNNLETAISANNLGSLLEKLGRYQEAELLFREALQVRKQILGEGHIETVTPMGNLGGALEAQAKYQEAEEVLLRTLELSRVGSGEDSESYQLACNNYGMVLLAQSRLKEAEAYLQESLDICQQIYPAEHAQIANSNRNMGALFLHQGKLVDAEKQMRKALELNRGIHGTDHPKSVMSVHDLASVLKEQGKLTEAEPLFIEVLNWRKRRLGPDHGNTLNAMNSLVSLYLKQKDLSKADPIVFEAVEIGRGKGSNQKELVLAIANLGDFYQHSNKFVEAEPLLQEAVELGREILGPDSLAVMRYLNNLAQFYSRQKRIAEAEPMFLEAIELSKRLAGPTDKDSLIFVDNLGLFYQRNAMPEKALAIFEQAYRACDEVDGEKPGYRLFFAETIVQLHLQLGNPEQAVRWATDLLAHTPDEDKFRAKRQALLNKARAAKQAEE
jgi:eukaryotic-like serine/threonine-protein kinase